MEPFLPERDTVWQMQIMCLYWTIGESDLRNIKQIEEAAVTQDW